jgi:WD40 repeat protein
MNLITVRIAGEEGEEREDLQISTGDQVGVSLTVVRNPLNGSLKLYVALGSKVNVYSLPDGDLVDDVSIGDNVNVINLNSMCDQLAVGCESGTIKVFSIYEEKINGLPDYVCEGHAKAVCAVAFSPRGNTMVSSAKDGTARVWNKDECTDVLTCSVKDPKEKVPPKRVTQVLVRGCAFGDLDGHLIYTMASGRRGKAFLTQWGLKDGKYECIIRTECSPCPVSAMSLSGDAGLMALGSVDGSVILWGIERWKALKIFPEVHDLPVTCIAARPFPVPLRGEEDGIQIHVLSASADSQLALLTLQRRPPKKRQQNSGSFKSSFNFWLRICLLSWILDEVLIAPSSRPGILVPPH